MLQSEFYDRTHVSLSAEEYAAVEHIYNSVQMDKDEFCKLWLENRDNQIIRELMQTISSLEASEEKLLIANHELQSKERQLREEYEKRLDRECTKSTECQESFVKRIIDILVETADSDMEGRIFSIIEEDFTLDFIVKYKLSKDYPLEGYERKYLIKKL